MSAITSMPVRFGMYSPTPGEANEPDIYAHVYRKGLRLRWFISAGRDGTILDDGRTWTRGGAMVAAIAAAHRPDVTGRRR